MSIGYDGKASGEVDSTTASDSLGRGERSLGKPVRIQEGQVRVTGKHEGFCALIIIDIPNASNTARWNICIEAMMRKKIPNNLL